MAGTCPFTVACGALNEGAALAPHATCTETLQLLGWMMAVSAGCGQAVFGNGVG